MIEQRQIEEINRVMEQAQRDYSKAKNDIESTKKELAEFVLLNSELVSTGEIDLSAYEEQIKEAEWEMSFSRSLFEDYKNRLTLLVSSITLR
jgi:predicted  nucleic acid-binding Zn-ribbon protein